MRQFLVLFFWTILCPWDSFAQLPGRNATINANNKTVGATVLPVILKDRGPSSMVSVLIKSPVIYNWNYLLEVSRIERIFPTGVSYVSRGNHISIYQTFERKFKLGHPVFNAIHLSVSDFHVRDENQFKPATNLWEIQGKVATKKGMVAGVIAEHRKDMVTETFTFDNLTFCADRYRLSNVLIHISSSSLNRYSTYGEISKGTYYGHTHRYAVRIGERFKFSNRIKGQLDVEYSRVEGERLAQGWLTRLMMSYQVSPMVSSGLFALNNSYNEVKGLMVYVQFTRSDHQIKLEYRELRDVHFGVIESTHPFFSSNYMIQYLYHLPAKTGKG